MAAEVEDAPRVRELGPRETELGAVAMLQLRTHLGSVDEVTQQIDFQRGEGYRVVASFNPGEAEAAAVAGFRVINDLFHGRHIYVDDLSTRESDRSHGHGAALMAWLEEEGRRHGCQYLTLDSGVQRFDAHRFYFREGLHISSHHFSKKL